MLTKKNIIISALCVLSIWVVYSANSFFEQKPFVVIQIYEETAVGDKNQIIGIVNAFKKHKQSLKVVDCPCNEKTDLSKLINDISGSKKNSLVIGVGKTAFAVLDQLSTKNLAHIKTLALGHQWTTAYSALLGKVTWIAVPDYAVPDSLPDLSRTKLIRTNGVSHAVTPESLHTECNAYKAKIPLTAADRVIILGGDAPTTAGVQKRFTKADAIGLAIAILHERNDGILYIVNGPRTGKLNENLEEIKNIHRDERIDAVTTAFIETLKKQGVSENRIKLYDFKFGQKSLYTPLLAAAFLSNTAIWVPGESSSMICQITSVIPPKNVLIYDNGAMNETHKKHVESVYAQGKGKRFYDGTLRDLIVKKVSLPDAHDQIVTVIIETIH